MVMLTPPFPARAGMTRETGRRGDRCHLFPARAGMTRQERQDSFRPPHVPRACGDDASINPLARGTTERSPHVRTSPRVVQVAGRTPDTDMARGIQMIPWLFNFMLDAGI